MWKAPGHRPLAPGPSHNRWKSRPPSTAPGIPTATHSLGDEEPKRKKRRKKTANRHFSIFPGLGTRRTTPSRPPARARPPRDDEPSHHPLKLHPRRGMTSVRPSALTQAPPREHQAATRADDYPTAHPLKLRLPWSGQVPPVRADASSPSRASGRHASGRLPNRPPRSSSAFRGPARFPPSALDAIAPSRAPAAVGRLPIRPPSRVPPSAG